jgi:hypothetical protein
VAETFVLGPSMRYARVEGLGVVLDIRSGTYKVLNDVATSMLEAIVGRDGEAERDAWRARYEVDPETAREDLARFVEACVGAGLIHRAEPAGPDAEAATGIGSSSRAMRGPRAARAVRALAATWRELRRDGFGPTYERCARTPLGPPGASREDCLRAFLRAENIWLSRRSPNDCLPRSLALFRYLRAEGVPAEHVIAVRRAPFAAHAWVESDGEALLGERLDGFTTLARIGAER